MKIIDKTTAPKTEFRNIDVGDVFYYENTCGVYMRTEIVFDNCGNIMANAVNLHFGSLCSFLPEYKVTPLNCECIITNK